MMCLLMRKFPLDFVGACLCLQIGDLLAWVPGCVRGEVAKISARRHDVFAELRLSHCRRNKNYVRLSELNERGRGVNKVSHNLALWLLLGLVFLVLFNVFNRQQVREPERPFSDFYASVEKGDVAKVLIQGKTIHWELKNDERFKTFSPEDP